MIIYYYHTWYYHIMQNMIFLYAFILFIIVFVTEADDTQMLLV